jgi:hypothetical protein
MHHGNLSIDKRDVNKIAQDAADRIVSKAGLELNRQHEIVLYLTKDGDLYREPKERYFYPMRESKLRLKILNTLNHEYKQTEDIRDQIRSMSTGAVRKAIHEINEKAESLLKLEHKLVESKPYSGYKINSIYYIEYIE